MAADSATSSLRVSVSISLGYNLEVHIAHSSGPKRSLTVSAAEDFDQIRMECIDPLQYAYELIRPLLLFGETAAERGRQTGVDRSVIGEKARRFVTDGMNALGDGRSQPAVGDGPTYPEAIAGYILYLKQLYPPIHLREIERILARPQTQGSPRTS